MPARRGPEPTLDPATAAAADRALDKGISSCGIIEVAGRPGAGRYSSRNALPNKSRIGRTMYSANVRCPVDMALSTGIPGKT